MGDMHRTMFPLATPLFTFVSFRQPVSELSEIFSGFKRFVKYSYNVQRPITLCSVDYVV